MKIGTHNSATGEASTWWSWLLSPFAKTQTKTIKEQWDAGCRLFDIRVKKVFGVWRCAHGWWFTKRTFFDILKELDTLSYENKENVHILLTYEGKAKNAGKFKKLMERTIDQYKMFGTYMRFGPISAKYGLDSHGIKVKYDVLTPGERDWIDAHTEQAFLPLSGQTLHILFPVPIFWKLFYFRKVEFDNDTYKFVDFL